VKIKLKEKKRLPKGRPPGIAQPNGPERIRRKIAVIYDSILKRALAGEAAPARLCLEIVNEIKPSPQGRAFRKGVYSNKRLLEATVDFGS